MARDHTYMFRVRETDKSLEPGDPHGQTGPRPVLALGNDRHDGNANLTSAFHGYSRRRPGGKADGRACEWW